MRGRYKFVVSSNKVKYEFELRRNITILKGDSATGKSTLLEMMNDALVYGRNSGYTVAAEVGYFVYLRDDPNITWQERLRMNRDAVIFIEEGNNFVKSDEFSMLLQELGNYVVIVTRDKISALPYSVHEIYELRVSNKYVGLSCVVNEFHNLYGKSMNDMALNQITGVCTEDSNSGYDFFKKVCENAGLHCISAGGKSKVAKQIIDTDNTLFIVDGAAFGADIEECMKTIRYYHKRCVIWFPESFEFLILSSGVIQIKNLRDILEHTSDYVDSGEFLSWERYFTALLTQATIATEQQYSKGSLNRYYISQNVIKRVLSAFSNELQCLFDPEK